MRKVAGSAAAILSLCVGTALAQQDINGSNNTGQNAAAYWKTPGKTNRDQNGNITYAEIKDPKTFTMKVLDNGEWFTYHYRPNSTDIVSIDTPDSTEQLLYDTAGKPAGITVHAGGRSHTVRYDRDKGIVATDNMPTVTIDQDPSSIATRDLRVRRGSQVVASVNYGASGRVQSLTVGQMTLSFTLTDAGVKETLRAEGVTLRETTAAIARKRVFRVLLDPVAERLHLTKEWANETQSKTTDYMTTIRRGVAPVARVVNFGGMQVAFDADGAPLLYDVMISYGSNYAGGDPQANNYMATAAYAAVLPAHIIITADGNLGAYVEGPGDGAIRAFWTTTINGQTTYNYSVYQLEAKKRLSSFGRLKTEGVAVERVETSPSPHSRRIAPLLFTVCDSETTCTYSDGCPSCAGCTTTTYWCNQNDGGGGYTPPPDYGGGTSSGNNNNITDVNTRMAVNRAINIANNKFTNTQCSDELLKAAMWDGTSACDALMARGQGESTADWFAGISWVYGEGVRNTNGQIPCQGASNWTTPGSTTDYVCKSFQYVGYPGNRLIHEMLHTLGMPECNGFSCANTSWPTSQQIDDLVAQYCGAN